MLKSKNILKDYTNRIAWMYWKQKISQKDIAKKFKINTVQVHRILNEAEKNGSVKVFVEGSFDVCTRYEEEIKKKYNLKHIEVVPSESLHGQQTTANTLDPDPLSIAYAGANTILNKINEENVETLAGLQVLQIRELQIYFNKLMRRLVCRYNGIIEK